jgi:hypothetical protein
MKATGQFCSVRGEWDTKNNLIKAIGQFGNQGVGERCFKNLMRATGQFGSIRGEWDTKNVLIKANGQIGNQKRGGGGGGGGVVCLHGQLGNLGNAGHSGAIRGHSRRFRQLGN